MIIRIVTGIHRHLPERVAEWALAIVLVRFGLILLAPGSSFETSPAFRVMAEMAREETWGWACLTIGSIRFMALVVNGTFWDTWYSRYSPHIRGFTAIASIFAWAQIVYGMASSGVNTTGLAVYPVLLVLDFWCVFHAFGDAKLADVRAANERNRGASYR